MYYRLNLDGVRSARLCEDARDGDGAGLRRGSAGVPSQNVSISLPKNVRAAESTVWSPAVRTASGLMESICTIIRVARIKIA